MTARAHSTLKTAHLLGERGGRRRTGPPSSRRIITKGQRHAGREEKRRGGGLKKASLVGAPRRRREIEGGREGTERSDETKEEGRPMLGDKSRLTSRESAAFNSCAWDALRRRSSGRYTSVCAAADKGRGGNGGDASPIRDCAVDEEWAF